MQEQDRAELVKRALDAAIGAMTRNRALLFTINLVAAIVLIVVYLELESFDEKQRRGHLVAVHRIAERLVDLGLIGSVSDPKIHRPSKLRESAIKKSQEAPPPWKGLEFDGKSIATRQEWLMCVGSEVYRLDVVANEMRGTRLPGNQGLPIGVSVPRNDVVPIAGLLLLLLYSWLLFSFRQLATIIQSIRRLLRVSDESGGNDDVQGEQAQSMVREIIEFHFLFRTSKRGPMKWFAHALYFSPPIVMLIALWNDLYSLSEMTGDWQQALQAFMNLRMLLLVALV